jgi:hypothetical protein
MIFFIAGLVVGGCVGVIATAIFTSGKLMRTGGHF